jgi:RNA polymerase sigma factor (sigma-70 family)
MKYEAEYKKYSSHLIHKLTHSSNIPLEDAEDAVQSFFVAIQYKDNINISNFLNYAFISCINHYRLALRRKKYNSVELLDTDLVYNPEQSYIDANELVAIRNKIKDLPNTQRNTLLQVLDGSSISEVAIAQQKSYDTVKANLRHGYMKLREGL